MTDKLINGYRDVVINDKCRCTAAADVEVQPDKQAIVFLNNAIGMMFLAVEKVVNLFVR